MDSRVVVRFVALLTERRHNMVSQPVNSYHFQTWVADLLKCPQHVVYFLTKRHARICPIRTSSSLPGSTSRLSNIPRRKAISRRTAIFAAAALAVSRKLWRESDAYRPLLSAIFSTIRVVKVSADLSCGWSTNACGLLHDDMCRWMPPKNSKAFWYTDSFSCGNCIASPQNPAARPIAAEPLFR